MQSHGGAAAVSDQSPKPKKPKCRQVSSRFLSSSSSSTDNNESPNYSTLSPLKPKPKSSTTDSRKHKSFDQSGFFRSLWPSSSPPSKPDTTTLADHLGNDRIKDKINKHKTNQLNQLVLSSLDRQRSCTEFSRFDNDKKIQKENHKPVFGGGSMRYSTSSSSSAAKFKFTGKSSSKSSYNDHQIHNDSVVPGRLSVDENALRKKSSARGLLLSDSDGHESESEYTDLFSAGTSFDTPVTGKDFPASYMAPTVSSRKHGIEVPSKFMHDLSSRSRRWSADNNNNNSNNSPKSFSLKSVMKGNNGNWDFSPKKALATNSKPPTTSPSKGGGNGVGNIISMGNIIELLKGKKYCSNNATSSPLGPGSAENIHQLRLLHNRLMQWRYTNARAQVANGNVIKHAERNLLNVLNGLIKLRQSVLQKKLHLQKEKLQMKLNYILHSQIKALEMWGNMERQHLSAVSATKDHLHSVVCRIPLVDGAKVEQHSASNAVRHASDLAASINMMITTFSPTIEKTVGVVAELATVVTQEKLLLEECFELFRNISALEVQERSLRGSIMQLRILQQQQYI